MNELDRALEEIAAMRGQVARAVEFRGFGPQVLVATALIACLGAAVQVILIGVPSDEPTAYVMLWTIAAAIAVALIGFEAHRRSRQEHLGLADDMLLAAARQFAPAGLAGLLASLIILRHAPESAWMLPGLWQILLSLGVFAALPSLPAAMFVVAVWYLATGLACLTFASGANALSPFAMAVPMGGGQILAACLLHRSYRGSNAEE